MLGAATPHEVRKGGGNAFVGAALRRSGDIFDFVIAGPSQNASDFDDTVSVPWRNDGEKVLVGNTPRGNSGRHVLDRIATRPDVDEGALVGTWRLRNDGENGLVASATRRSAPETVSPGLSNATWISRTSTAQALRAFGHFRSAPWISRLGAIVL